jgi:hypothetical protein
VARVLAPAHALEPTGELLPASPTDRWLRSRSPVLQSQVRLHLRLACDDGVASAVVRDAVDALPLLRSALDEVAGSPAHRVYRVQRLDLPVLDLAGGDPGQVVAGVLRGGARPFDLARAPRFRVAGVRVGERDLHLLWWISHSICDGESSSLLVRLLRDGVRAVSRGERARPSEPPSYAAYADHIDEMRWDGRDLAEHRRRLERFEAAVARLRGRLAAVAGDAPPAARNMDAGRLPGDGRLPELQARVVRAIARWAGLDEIPFVTTYHGRVYGTRRFFGTFGNLVDAVPVLVDGARGDIDAVASRVAAAIDGAGAGRVNHARLCEVLAAEGSGGPAGMAASPVALTFFEEVRTAEGGDGVAVVPVAEEPDERGEPSLEVAIRRQEDGLHLVLHAAGMEAAALDRLWSAISA